VLLDLTSIFASHIARRSISIGDIRDVESVASFVDAVLAQWGQIDVLINNAGV